MRQHFVARECTWEDIVGLWARTAIGYGFLVHGDIVSTALGTLLGQRYDKFFCFRLQRAVDRYDYSVDLTARVQTNKQTGARRAIRHIPAVRGPGWTCGHRIRSHAETHWDA